MGCTSALGIQLGRGNIKIFYLNLNDKQKSSSQSQASYAHAVFRYCNTDTKLWLLSDVAADWMYTFMSDSESVTQITEQCTVVSPRLLHKYANRTVYETHLAILSNIESAMLLSLSSEHVRDMQYNV